MRTWVLDQDEFETPDGEESLEVNCAARPAKREWQGRDPHVKSGKFRFRRGDGRKGGRTVPSEERPLRRDRTAPRRGRILWWRSVGDRIRTDLDRVVGLKIPYHATGLLMCSSVSGTFATSSFALQTSISGIGGGRARDGGAALGRVRCVAGCRVPLLVSRGAFSVKWIELRTTRN